MSKSNVSLGQHVCIVCAKTFNSGEILVDRRLRQSLETRTVTDWGMCPDCTSKKNEGYIALVGMDEQLSTLGEDTVKPSDAHRTGEVVHVRSSIWPKVFNVPVPSNGVAFVTPEVVELLKKLSKHVG